jgi:hypothetical protein
MSQLTKPKILISTIGTSLLTNQVDRNNPDEKLWQEDLRNEANASQEATLPLSIRVITSSKKILIALRLPRFLQ